MAAVTVTSVAVLNNPGLFTQPMQFEIQYECLTALAHGKTRFLAQLRARFCLVVRKLKEAAFVVSHCERSTERLATTFACEPALFQILPFLEKTSEQSIKSL